MMTFILSFIVFILAGLALAVGLLVGKRRTGRACCQLRSSNDAENPCCHSERRQLSEQGH